MRYDVHVHKCSNKSAFRVHGIVHNMLFEHMIALIGFSSLELHDCENFWEKGTVRNAMPKLLACMALGFYKSALVLSFGVKCLYDFMLSSKRSFIIHHGS